MIIEFLCNIFFSVIRFFVGLFPSFPSFDFLGSPLEPVFYVLGFINNFVSVALAGTCFMAILVVYNIKFVWSIIMWLVRKIPGVS